MPTPNTAHISALEQHAGKLRHDLRIAEAALAEARTRARLSALALPVYERMQSGQYPIQGFSGWWWADKGKLLDALTDDDHKALRHLESEGVIVMETARRAA